MRAPRSGALTRGTAMVYFSVIVLLPLAAVSVKAFSGGLGSFWSSVSSPEAVAALRLTILLSIVVAAINAVAGTLIAWVLVRDEFRGKGFVEALIDLPFALPTIVAGVTLLALYGPRSPFGLNVAYTRVGVAMALLFVTLPFVVRAVQPALMALEPEAEEAAASLGASPPRVFRSIVLPAIAPAITSGVALAFARAVGEFGSVVLIAGNLPFKTEVASVFLFSRIESDDVAGAASVSIVLLAISVAMLTAIAALSRRASRHER